MVRVNLCGDDVSFLCVSCCTSYSHRWPPTAWRHRQHGAADCDFCLGRGVHYLFVLSFVVVVFMVSQFCCFCCAVALVAKCVVCVALLVGLVVGIFLFCEWAVLRMLFLICVFELFLVSAKLRGDDVLFFCVSLFS